MSTISAQLRNFKDPDRDEQSLLFFAIPPSLLKGVSIGQNSVEDGHHKMEINAVLSLATEGAEDPYVRVSHDFGPMPSRVANRKNLGWKVTSRPTLPRIRQRRQKVCPVHDPPMHGSESRTFEYSCRCLRAQSLTVAWHEDSMYSPAS